MVSAEPPSAPAVKATDNDPFEGVIAVIVGALGVVRGVAAVVAEAVPSPAALTALIWIEHHHNTFGETFNQ